MAGTTKPVAPVASVNPHRGEAEIVLDGQTYGLRPSYEAIVEIEKQAGGTIGAMSMSAANVGLPLGTLSIIVAELIKAWGRANNDATMARVNARRIGEMIQENSIIAASYIVAKVLTDALTGEYTAAGELKPTKTTSDTSTVG